MAGSNRKAAPLIAAALALTGGACLVLPASFAPASLAIAALQTSDAAAVVQEMVGKPAPDFALPDQNGKTQKLSEQRGKWVVLAFYPADMTTGCTFQNKSYSEKINDFGAKNAVVYTVSTQDTKSKQAFCSKEGLKHTLLSDVEGTTSQAYHVFMDGPKLARRVTFYIAPDGKVAAVDTRINTRQAADDSLLTLAKLSSPTPAAPPAEGAKTLDGQAVTTVPTQGFFTGPAATKVRLNEPVADFGLPDTVSGKNLGFTTLSAGKKATVIVYVSTQCPVSNAYNERLAQLATEYAAKGVQFIGINSNNGEAAPEIGAHAKQNEWTFPVLKDTGNKIADRFEAKVTPEVFVTDAKGTLVYHGPIDDSQDAGMVTKKYLSVALDAVLAGQPAPAADKRAFGCGIKRAPTN